MGVRVCVVKFFEAVNIQRMSEEQAYYIRRQL